MLIWEQGAQRIGKGSGEQQKNGKWGLYWMSISDESPQMIEWIENSISMVIDHTFCDDQLCRNFHFYSHRSNLWWIESYAATYSKIFFIWKLRGNLLNQHPIWVTTDDQLNKNLNFYSQRSNLLWFEGYAAIFFQENVYRFEKKN